LQDLLRKMRLPADDFRGSAYDSFRMQSIPLHRPGATHAAARVTSARGMQVSTRSARERAEAHRRGTEDRRASCRLAPE